MKMIEAMDADAAREDCACCASPGDGDTKDEADADAAAREDCASSSTSSSCMVDTSTIVFDHGFRGMEAIEHARPRRLQT